MSDNTEKILKEIRFDLSKIVVLLERMDKQFKKYLS